VADLAVAILLATLAAGTPLVLAALGELVTERTGVLNLGVEGMMLVGAATGFAAAAETGSVIAAAVAGSLAGAALAALFAFVTLVCRASQVASGLALTILGIGLSALIGAGYTGVALPSDLGALPAWLAALPVLGAVLAAIEPFTALSIALAVGIWWFLARTRSGLILRAVGDAPQSAVAAGYRVGAIRCAAVLFGGAMAGLAGVYLSVVYTPVWVENMTAGRGWIAIALVVFASWSPLRVLVGAYLFGGITILQFHLQGAGLGLPPQYLSMLPYLATILVLVVVSSASGRKRLRAPASLGGDLAS
jgi:ABC-type uncharacterized transport system permease subunit